MTRTDLDHAGMSGLDSGGAGWDDGFAPVVPGLGETVDGTVGVVQGFAGLVTVLVIGGIVFSIVVGVRKYRILRDAGADPFTVDAAVAAKVLKSDMLAPGTPQPAERSVEERLRELDDLRGRGVITDDEHREARAAVLRGS